MNDTKHGGARPNPQSQCQHSDHGERWIFSQLAKREGQVIHFGSKEIKQATHHFGPPSYS
jgi:hypothetical protein